jgi:hypothetical protein
MRVLVLVLILIGCGFQSVYSQRTLDSTKFKMHYFGTLLSGVLIGCSNCTTGNQLTASAYLINGLQLTKSFGVGIGVGADSYQQWKTMPFFLHLSQKIAGSKNTLLLQLNSGYAWAWYDRQENTLPNFQQTGGFMIHPALTYQIGIEKWNLKFSVGYKSQVTGYSSRFEYQSFRGLAYNETTVKNEFNRLVLQIGFGWR